MRDHILYVTGAAWVVRIGIGECVRTHEAEPLQQPTGWHRQLEAQLAWVSFVVDHVVLIAAVRANCGLRQPLL